MIDSRRWWIVLATFLLSVLLYVDRICISAAKDEVSSDLGLSSTQMGWVFAAFSLGYALMQTPSGYLADRLGPRRILSLIVGIWSVFTGLTALANSFISMIAIRFLFGAGEAGAFPGIARASYSWIPMQERGMVQGINFSGSRVGAALALPAITWLVLQVGWRATFAILMAIGFLWALAWYLWFRDDPSQASWLSQNERDHILKFRQCASQTVRVETEQQPANHVGLSMFKSVGFWALCGQYFASNFTFFFGLTWFFPQLKSRYGLTGMEASLFAAAPMICGVFGNCLSGWWVDSLYKRGHWRRSRLTPAIIGFFLAAIGILGIAYASTPLAASILFSLCIFGADMTLAPSWSTCVDIGRESSGVVSGTMNMAGNIGSFLTSLAFPFMLESSGSSLPFFYLAAILNIVACGLWLMVDPTKPLGGQS